MPDDDPIFDLHTPYPKAVIEGLRRSIVAALDDLGQQVQRIDDAYLMLLATCGMAQSTLNVTKTARAQFEAVNARIDALEEFVREQQALDPIPTDPAVAEPQPAGDAAPTE